MNQARLSLHIISIVAYNLHHTVSARLKTQTHFCVSENHVNEPHENHGLIHDILQQATEGALYLCEICNGIGLRERGSEECAYFGDRLTKKTDTHPGHTSGRVLTWATDMVSFCSCVWSVWLQPSFAVLQTNPATFEDGRDKPRGESDPALCWRV